MCPSASWRILMGTPTEVIFTYIFLNYRMPESLANRRKRMGSLKLRRLTQAYLTPYDQLAKDSSGQRIDEIYGITQDLILNYQSVTSGLFPRSSKDKSLGYVKDSIYCAMACWACSKAYERMDDDRGRQTELRQSAVKTMRGILFSWMQQVDELNTFKNNNLAKHALHARFDLETGLPIESHADHGYGHLQMDLIALYIIAMVQMISAGAKIIFTHDEVCFIQNLVFYIERTYRTPDFGMWERGTRYNRGQPELHASSLGLVKAALEAVNGFNLYGSAGTSASVVYVDIDGHDRNRTTFEAILPRESNSKNTDAALLITVGWPAFATHNKAIFDKAVTKCVRRLEGKYGMKRFLRDGHLTELEDNTRPYYEEHETHKFDSIESQFPLFFACIAITAKLKGDDKIYDEYWNKLQGLLVSDSSVSGGWILPECYYVDEVNAEEEKKHGGTELSPVSPSEFGHHLWSNAVYIILLLLRDNLIHPGDLDPINRRMPASQRPKNLNRHSAFQGSMEGADPVVQMAIISESTRLQSMLSTYGIPSQTPHEVEPIQIWPSARMVKVFECLGRSKRLGLSGRPARPFGPLGTSKVFRVFGDTILCYPLLFEVKDFYLSSDPAVLIDNIKRDVEFVAKRWKLDGRPTMCIVLREENVAGEYLDHILDLLVQLKNGYVNGVRVRLGRVHQLLNSACMEHVDFASSHDIDFDVAPLEETQGGQMLASHTSLKEGSDEEITETNMIAHNDHELTEIVARDCGDSPRSTAFAIWILMTRHGNEHEVNGVRLETRLDRIYRRACASRSWWLVRYCAGRLRKTMNSLAPGITSILVRGKQVTLGDRRVREVTLNKPHTPVEIVHLLFSSCPPDDPQAAVMQQELIIACADLIAHNSEAFNGVLTIRLSWLQEAIKLLLQYVKCSDLLGTSASCPPTPQTTGIPTTHHKSIAQIVGSMKSVKRCDIYDLSPTVIKDVVRALMTREHWHLLSNLQTRRLNGSLNRVPTDFYDRVWKILERSAAGIVIAGQYLPQQPTLSDMTQFELNFSYKLEEMMSTIVHPEYRQLIVELLCIVATLLERNPEVAFHDKFDCEEVIWKAFHLYGDQEGIEQRTDLRPFYQLENVNMKTSTATYLTKAIVELILNSRHISREFDIHTRRHRADSPKENDPENACSVS
ncbi:hypothetical protein PFISCL1PPCAC_16324 [Pristionchus fissidentatus]|uniref:Phosphorylase b kinase regulatory subunit n=1 Tax=Pristionchus fissidentatus TaxID=1538716 RepID=A0AAV5VZK4_9BILA|nr:hypothetical protein PFISCL1PPCAC_16324 [Pristionchus fissidentatus]